MFSEVKGISLENTGVTNVSVNTAVCDVSGSLGTMVMDVGSEDTICG